ncbi:hypothetical protein ENBRE01_0306 [Enteropsectra breve]|nr:hypothetical protein ENBRE01_0306 [Enteropsectra breve]
MRGIFFAYKVFGLCECDSAVSFFDSKERLLSNHFMTSVANEDRDTAIFDLRDVKELCRLDVNLFKTEKMRDLEKTVLLRQIKALELIAEAHNEAGAKLYESENEYMKRIQQCISNEENHALFDTLANSISAGIIISKNIDFEILKMICEMRSNWCHNLEVKADREILKRIIENLKYLNSNTKETADVFISKRNSQIHLRINRYVLFCINFVYLIQKNADFNDLSSDLAQLCIGFENSHFLKAAINLFKVKIVEGEAVGVLVRKNDAYFREGTKHDDGMRYASLFVPKHRHNGNSAKKCTSKSHSTLDLIDITDKFNFLNQKSFDIKRINIVIPKFKELDDEEAMEETYRIIRAYYDFMVIFSDITDVHIYNPATSALNRIREKKNCLHYIRKVFGTGTMKCLASNPIANENSFYEIVLEEICRNSMRSLKKMTELSIMGYISLTDGTVDFLRNSQLQKLGLLSYFKQVDLLNIGRVFEGKSSIRKTLTHFSGNYYSVEKICEMMRNTKLCHVKQLNYFFFDECKLYKNEAKALKELSEDKGSCPKAAMPSDLKFYYSNGCTEDIKLYEDGNKVFMRGSSRKMGHCHDIKLNYMLESVRPRVLVLNDAYFSHSNYHDEIYFLDNLILARVEIELVVCKNKALSSSSLISNCLNKIAVAKSLKIFVRANELLECRAPADLAFREVEASQIIEIVGLLDQKIQQRLIVCVVRGRDDTVSAEDVHTAFLARLAERKLNCEVLAFEVVEEHSII